MLYPIFLVFALTVSLLTKNYIGLGVDVRCLIHLLDLFELHLPSCCL